MGQAGRRSANLAPRIDDVHWQTNLTSFVDDGALDGLANPPMGISGEAKTAAVVKAVNRFHPVSLIGSSGAFDTIGDIHCIKNKIKKRIGDYKRLVDTNAFDPIHRELISKNRIERLQIPGMVPMRADMIVVASCLIDYVINQYSINHLIVSSYSLKEGMLAKLLESEIALQETL